MVITVISWIVIFIVFCGTGLGLSKLINRVFGYNIAGMHGVVMLGFVFCTMYAEAFSLVYKLGALSFIILSLIMLLLLVYSGGEAYDRICGIKRDISENKSKYFGLLVVFLGILFLASYIASREPVGFDAENYHIPDIRWLEEYGAVKGVGNVAPWFAYNSSFHCLQALFSFVWVLGMSLHSMNGFVWMFIMMYAVGTSAFFTGRRFGLSDVLRIVLIKNVFGCLILQLNEPLAAPMTDFVPLCLVGYIFAEWCSLNEEGVEDEAPYGLLSILGLFAASVKLSAAIIFIIVLKPLCGLIKQKRISEIVKFVVLGILVMLPFVLRSIVISGYLVYPVAAIDLFNVDWKMPRAVAVSDDAAIKLFARAAGTKYSYFNISDSFGTWFVNWLQHNWAQYSTLAIINLVLAPCTLAVIIYMILRKRKGLYDHIVYVGAAAGFLFLITSAPALRFGIIWFYILPAVCIYGLLEYITDKEGSNMPAGGDKVQRKPHTYGILAFLTVLLCIVHFYMIEMYHGFDAKVVPKDYSHVKDEDYTYEISGYKFYYTNPEGDNTRTSEGSGLIGYDGFPGSCNLAYLKKVELRGADIKDGFRPKAGYDAAPYGHNGKLLEEGELEILGLDKYYKRQVDK